MNLMVILLIIFILDLVVIGVCWWLVYNGMKKQGRRDYFLGRKK